MHGRFCSLFARRKKKNRKRKGVPSACNLQGGINASYQKGVHRRSEELHARRHFTVVLFLLSPGLPLCSALCSVFSEEERTSPRGGVESKEERKRRRRKNIALEETEERRAPSIITRLSLASCSQDRVSHLYFAGHRTALHAHNQRKPKDCSLLVVSTLFPYSLSHSVDLRSRFFFFPNRNQNK